ncbi:MAG TPA: hypothetical protein VGM23_13895, partial [Armatimonadota bacterium]
MPADVRYMLLAFLTFAAGVFLTREFRRGFSRFRSREQKAGKELIYRHFPRQKKPLGGGMAIFAALGVGFLLAFLLRVPVPNTAWLWLFSGIAFAGIGFIDDWRKVNAAQGLGEWSKLFLQIIAALVCTWFIISIRLPHDGDYTAIFIPFVGWQHLGVLFIPFGTLVIVGMANAVNLTDGLDGLAGSSVAISFACYLVLGSLLQHEGIPPLITVLTLAAL